MTQSSFPVYGSKGTKSTFYYICDKGVKFTLSTIASTMSGFLRICCPMPVLNKIPENEI